jgi:tripartite-type tricarboxylate transporter receptor subunit TctC
MTRNNLVIGYRPGAREGAIPVGATPREFDAFIAAERSRLGEVIRKAGIALQ